jgi:hypothetical protein
MYFRRAAGEAVGPLNFFVPSLGEAGPNLNRSIRDDCLLGFEFPAKTLAPPTLLERFSTSAITIPSGDVGGD